MKIATLGLAALVAFVLLAAITWSKDLPADTLKRKDQILTRFSEEFVQLTPGRGRYPASFLMGSPEQGRANEQPAHKVTFSHDFGVAKYEVTQELYFVVMGKNPAKWKGPRNSVEMVNWHEANDFCVKVTAELRRLNLLKGKESIRLPSEAEWEYACRAGSTSDYSFGDKVEELGKFAWYHANAPGNDPPVGKKLPNAWDLYDLHGYVWEWCADSGHDDYKTAPADGSAWVGAGAKEHMIRGGSYADSAEAVRSASRRSVSSDFRSDTVGFRCVLSH